MPKKAVIVGAGPAGLTAAYELLTRTDIVPTVLEASEDIGGISKTVHYKGNRIDIGGHRFFSKSERVMRWWADVFPIEAAPEPDPKHTDKVMLRRDRLSRIFFLGKFFPYPIRLTLDVMRKLGALRAFKICLSYLMVRLRPIRPERSLEDFFINRFGRELYLTFFKGYTEKVWGAPCAEISPEWGAQRIKGLSVGRAVSHAIRQSLGGGQPAVETSLIENFLYPKLGPGQLWEEVAARVQQRGGKVITGAEVVGVETSGRRVTAVTAKDRQTGGLQRHEADWFFSTMPVRELVAAMGEAVPQDVRDAAAGLQYRDFMTVGLLLKKLKTPVPDNWIYVQERGVRIGRLQVFNNWSPWLVADPEGTVWLGLEYFCTEGDGMWSMPDDEFARFAIGELASIGLIDPADVLDHKVLRVPKAYPAYIGGYDRFGVVRRYLDGLENLFLIGRNGMHRYNNMDHSMLTAMAAVENIIAGRTDKTNIWAINAEDDYHEGS